MDPLVITVASSNINWTKRDNPYMPETPEQIAGDIIKASEEGATVAHIHARDDNGRATFNPNYYRKIVEQIRKHRDIIIQMSTGGFSAPLEERLAPVRELRPHMASIDFRHTPEDIEYMATAFKELEVIPVIEVFHVRMIETANTLIKRGLVKQPAHFEFVFDLLRESNKKVLEDYDEMVQRIKAIFPGSIWSRCRGSDNQFALDVMTIMFGGHIRAGLEDNLFFASRQLAHGSFQFVKRIRELSAVLNRKVATVEEAKELFKITR